MKNFKKDMFGFAHHALLGVVVVAVIAFAGVKVLTGIHAASPPTGSFSPNQNHLYANSENYVTLDVATLPSSHASKVVWYRDKVSDATRIESTFNGTLKKDKLVHFQYIWHISTTPANQYRWVAQVYTPNGTSLAVNSQGNPYLDTYVLGNGRHGGKIIYPDNNATLSACTQDAYVRVELLQRDIDFKDIKGVQFINISDTNPIQYTLTSPAYKHQFHQNETEHYYGYDYPAVGLGCLKKGSYHWIARVLDVNGGAYLAEAHQGSGVYYLDMTVK